MTAALADIPMRVRPWEVEEVDFVWETSLKVRKPHSTPWREWEASQGEKLLAQLNALDSRVSVLDAFDGLVVGFAHWLGPVLQMLYVKRDLRGFGYGLQLLGVRPEVVLVHRPNTCWRRWTYLKGIRWKEAD